MSKRNFPPLAPPGTRFAKVFFADGLATVCRGRKQVRAMTADSLGRNPGIAKLVERQMRNWELARAQRVKPPEPARPEVEQFLAISRAVGAGGAGGAEVPARIGERLDWPVFNKELLQAMADDDRIRTQLYDSMDERDLGWFELTLRALTQGEFKKHDYFHRLTHTILALARQGHAVFVGRAADLILPRTLGLRVRLTAPREACVARHAEHRRISREEAHAEVARIEEERAEFIRHHFRDDPSDPSRHDLVVNLERFDPTQAVDLILTAMMLRGVFGEP